MTEDDNIEKVVDIMAIIEMLGALIMGGLALAVLRNLWKSQGDRVHTQHIN